MLAIPVTLTAKLVTGKHLFTDSMPVPLDLANQQETTLAFVNVTTASAALSDSTKASNDFASTALMNESASLGDLHQDLTFTIIGTLADTVNHLIAGILDAADETSRKSAEKIAISQLFLALKITSRPVY